MRIEKISVKTLTVSLLLLFGALSIILTFISTNYNRKAAIHSHIHSMTRVLEVATQETIKEIKKHAINLGANIQNGSAFRTELNALLKNEPNRLQPLLDDPFINGFVGAREIELAKLRIYDLDFKLLIESNKGVQGLPPQMPDSLLKKAEIRTGIDRIRATDVLWRSSTKSLYSTLIPLGGLRIIGYMEVVLDPVFNLTNISNITQIPVNIFSTNTNTLIQSGINLKSDATILPIEFILQHDDGSPAFKITAFDSIKELNINIAETQFGIISAFLTLTGITIILTLWIFNRFLFRPSRNMIEEMEESMEKDSCASINTSGLKEFHLLATTFNTMSRKIQANIKELQILSSQDGLTSLANRRHFDHILEQEWKRGLRKLHTLSLLIIDVDYFKLFNDTYGHQAGDKCLQQVANSLKKTITRSCDLAARYGGEEFVVIMPETTAAGAIQVARNVLNEIHNLQIPHASSAVTEHDIVSVSIGVSTITPNSNIPAHLLIAMADKALYEAKENGRNNIKIACYEKDRRITVSTEESYRESASESPAKVHYL